MFKKTVVALLVPCLTVFAGSTVHAQHAAGIDCVNIVSIPDIQGASHRSGYVDQFVETCGVVTAVAFGGYYLQDPLGDGDVTTSDGIFVAQRDDKPDVGTLLRLSATVEESIPGGASTGNLPVTQLVEPTILANETDTALPAAIVLGVNGRMPPTSIIISDDETDPPINLQDENDAQGNVFDPESDALDFFESLEGMLVTVPEPVAISATRQFGNFSAEVFVLADKGAGVEPSDALTSRGALLLQPDPDNSGDQNPERIQLQFDATLYGGTDFPAIPVGATLNTVSGVLGYSFGNFEVQVIGPVQFVPKDNADEVTTLTSSASDLRVATYNVLNLSAVGADDDQRNLIATHIVRNMESPDVIALQEIQDNNGDSGDCPRDEPEDCADVLDASQTLQALVDAIEAAGSGVQYRYFNVDPLVETSDDTRDDPDTFGGVSLGNIRNAFLFNPARVALKQFQGLTRDVLADRGVSTSTAFDGSRDPLEATFIFNGQEVTMVNNHFSSRFGSTPLFGAVHPFVQAAEADRERQALAMHENTRWWLKNDPDAKVIVLGDLNTFEFTDDLTDILPAASGDTLLSRVGFMSSAIETDPYTFIFEGNAQSLDHVFATDSLISRAEADVIHVNVDSPRMLDSVVGSDHEPILARFQLLDEANDDAELALRAEVYSSTALELFWRRDPLASQYQVSRDGKVLEVLDGLSFFDSALSPGTTYRYDVVSSNAQGALHDEAIVVRTRDGEMSVAPSLLPVSNLSALVYSSTAIELFWDPADGSIPSTGYDISRNGELIASSDGRSFFDQGLSPDTEYVYSVTTVSANGPVGAPASVVLKTNSAVPSTGSVSPVSSLTGKVYSSTALEIFWQSARGEMPIAEYQIVRNGETLDVRDARSYFDGALMPDTEYRYSVIAVDIAGNPGPVAELTLKTAAR